MSAVGTHLRVTVTGRPGIAAEVTAIPALEVGPALGGRRAGECKATEAPLTALWSACGALPEPKERPQSGPFMAARHRRTMPKI
jgi:hypothetical protein